MQSFGSASENGQRYAILSCLAVVGVAWYIVLWSIGLLGCYAAYDSSIPSRPSLTFLSQT